MKLVFLGPPGAGKGTQAEFICKNYDIAHISTGDILRANINNGTELGKQAKAYIDNGKLVPDALIIDIVSDRIAQPDCANGYLLDGFPRTVAQAEALSQLVTLDAVLDLEVPFEKLTDRITGRRVCKACGATYHINSLASPDGPCEKCGGELYQRADDTKETIVNRLNVYTAQTQPLIDYYTSKGIVRTINGDASIQAVQDEIKQILETL